MYTQHSFETIYLQLCNAVRSQEVHQPVVYPVS